MAYYKKMFWLLSSAVIGLTAYNRIFKKKTNRKEINEVIMFANGGDQIVKSKFSRCMITSSMDRLLYYISQPQYNFDICMYAITNMEIISALLKLIFQGIKIRLIIDADMAYSCGSGVKNLVKHGVPIRWMKTSKLMHHKFCLADTLCNDSKTTPFVMTGSLNWTNQALSGNYENNVVTTEKELVKQYQDEFERLWILFKPIIE